MRIQERMIAVKVDMRGFSVLFYVEITRFAPGALTAEVKMAAHVRARRQIQLGSSFIRRQHLAGRLLPSVAQRFAKAQDKRVFWIDQLRNQQIELSL